MPIRKSVVLYVIVSTLHAMIDAPVTISAHGAAHVAFISVTHSERISNKKVKNLLIFEN